MFKKKLRFDGTIDKYKTKVVIKDINQNKDDDYFDTYSPRTKLTTIRNFIALAIIHDLFVYQMDVKATFLNGELEEEIYMTQPEGFVVP